jgi:CBS domain-containing protein
MALFPRQSITRLPPPLHRGGDSMKSAGDVVRGQDIATVDPAMSVAEAARVMAARHIGAVPVADGDRIVGIFTERDALTRVIAAGLDPARTPVRDVMSSTLVVADVVESYETCLDRMRQARIRHLIVLDHDHLAGIISMRDLLAVDLDDKVETISLLNAYVQYVPADIANRRP